MPGPIPARWGPRLLSVLRIVAAFLFMAHGAQKLFAWPVSEPREFWPIVNHGELAVLYCFLFLYFGAVGGGPWSLDALRPHGDQSRSSG